MANLEFQGGEIPASGELLLIAEGAAREPA